MRIPAWSWPDTQLSAYTRFTGRFTLACAVQYGRHAQVDASRIAIQALEAATGSPQAHVSVAQ